MSKEIKISTFTGALTRLGTLELVVDTLKEAGFKYYDHTMMYPILGFDLLYDSDDYIEKAKRFRKYTDKVGIYCNQTHGAVPLVGKDFSKEDNEKILDNVKRTIEVSHILGAKCCVLHPSSDCSIKENAERFKLLKEVAHKYDVIVAIENMPSATLFGKPEDFLELLKEIDDDHFAFCLDIGHAEIEWTGSSAVDFINKMGDKLVCLHIHDNEKGHDLHQLPYNYMIDFEAIWKALKANHYQGDITFETGSYSQNLPNSLYVSSLELLHALGELIKEKITNSSIECLCF